MDEKELSHRLVYLGEICEYGKERCDNLLNRKLSFVESESLIKMFRSFFDGIEHSIVQELKTYSLYDPERVRADIQLTSQLLRWIHGNFINLEPLGTENISQSNVYLFNYLSSKLGLDEDRRINFIFMPTYEFNFMHYDIINDISKILEELEYTKSPAIDELINELEKYKEERFVLIGFPFVFRGNVILDSIIGHEIGHSIYNKRVKPSVELDAALTVYLKQISDKIDTLSLQIANRMFPETRIEYSQRGKKKRKAEGKKEQILSIRTNFFYPSIKAELTRLIVESSKNYVEEMFSDIVGLRVLGPVYVESLFDFLIAATLTSPFSWSHPSFLFRIQYLCSEYGKFDRQDPVINSVEKALLSYDRKEMVKNSIDNLLKGMEADQDFSNLPFYLRRSGDDATEPVDTIVSLIEKFVSEFVSSNLEKYLESGENTYKEIAGDRDILVTRLKKGFPPCETKLGVPADIPAILNAGNRFKLDRIEEVLESINSDKDIVNFREILKIDRSIFKAVELSSVHSKLKRSEK